MNRLSLPMIAVALVVLCATGLVGLQFYYGRQRQQASDYIENLRGNVQVSSALITGSRDAPLFVGFCDIQLDRKAYVVSVDLHAVEELPPHEELVEHLQHFPHLKTVTFPNLLDGNDYVRAVLSQLDGVGMRTAGPVRDNRTDPNTSPAVVKTLDYP